MRNIVINRLNGRRLNGYHLRLRSSQDDVKRGVGRRPIYFPIVVQAAPSAAPSGRSEAMRNGHRRLRPRAPRSRSSRRRRRGLQERREVDGVALGEVVNPAALIVVGDLVKDMGHRLGVGERRRIKQEGIGAGTTGQDVMAALSRKDIVAVAAVEVIVSQIAVDDVIAITTNRVLDDGVGRDMNGSGRRSSKSRQA